MNPAVFKHEEVDPVGEMLGTGYNRFFSACGIEGLAKEQDDGKRIDILAVHSIVPKSGAFRAFISKLKEHYQTVCVWEDWNPIVGPALERYGFTPETEIQGDGEILKGWRWDK